MAHIRFDQSRGLLSLPPEILSNIVDLVESSSLGSLALVNSYCRQLARPHQFASFQFAFTLTSHQMLDLLMEEGRQRHSSANTDRAQYGYLGSCIRRVLVDSSRRRPARFLYVDGYLRVEESEAEAAAKLEYMAYIERLQFVIASQSILPTLEYLDWRHYEGTPSSSFYNGLTSSKIQCLKIRGIPMDADFEIGTDCPSWPLRALHMESNWIKKKAPDVLMGDRMSPLCTGLLRQCASSLETLTWISTSSTKSSSNFEADPQSLAADSSHYPQFPKLTVLEVRDINFPESSVFDTLLASPLSVLVTQHEAGSNIGKSLVKVGCIKSLRTFVWQSRRIPGVPDRCSFDFLQANPQISKLCFLSPTPPDPLESELLPLLHKSFKALTSLSLCWKGNYIPESALSIMSGLHMLEQLHLSAGTPAGWRHDWPIDHDLMRNHLSHLPRLRNVAFSRDTYRLEPSDDPMQGSYYRHTRSSDIVRDIENLGAENVNHGNLDQLLRMRWEERHRDRMIAEADEYAISMPKLEWLFIGQLQMRMTESHGSPAVMRHAEVLTEKRCEKASFLKRMFAWECVDDRSSLGKCA